jgi:predicted TIM-barrel fold metal-dependent hydrolase
VKKITHLPVLHNISLKDYPGTNITRRDFVKTAATVTTATLAGGNMMSPDVASATTRGQTKQRRWIDTHIHICDIGVDGRKRERMLEDLLDVLDRCDADLRFVISVDGTCVTQANANPATMMSANRMLYDLCRSAPGRLYGSCWVNPNFPDEALRVMKICFEEWHFVQLGELWPHSQKFRMNDRSTEKVVRLAAEYDVPVHVHLGTWWCKGAVPGDAMDGMNQMGDLLNVAERVPQAKYILAHAIGSARRPECISWANMYLDTLKGLFPKFPENFWVEICNFQCPAVQRAIREIPVTRLLSGTDWKNIIGPPFQSYGTLFGYLEKDNPFPPKVGSFVEFLLKAGATEADIARIGYENARELYKLPT